MRMYLCDHLFVIMRSYMVLSFVDERVDCMIYTIYWLRFNSYFYRYEFCYCMIHAICCVLLYLGYDIYFYMRVDDKCSYAISVAITDIMRIKLKAFQSTA